ncbi:MAG TPA: CDP-alcohol phosphatidyltransferase family protein [Chitinophagaceae bacterium]|nr:CDP-alcohol phosphatidyltransferase family protein [Chitinophagaceae bacterium]
MDPDRFIFLRDNSFIFDEIKKLMTNNSPPRGLARIPNLFTLLNLIFGCLAIIFILQTGETIVLLRDEGFTDVNLPEKITWGSFMIFAAAIVDFLDGFIARLFRATSKMGEQLDSLADVVSFGLAPGLILYQLLRISYAQEENGLDISIAWLLPALLIPCAAAWRLAKFNLDIEQRVSFKGVPTPAAALVIASLPLIIHFQTFNLQFLLINKWILYAVIILLTYLMISNLPLIAMKASDLSLKNNLARYILLVLGIIAAITLRWLAVPVIFVLYVIISLAFKNKTS